MKVHLLLRTLKKHLRLVIGLGILLVLTVYAVLNPYAEPSTTTPILSTQATVLPASTAEADAAPSDDESPIEIVDIFATRTWLPPPPPPPPPAPPPPPQPPPLPFKLVGQINEATGKTFLLAYKEQIFTVQAGSNIDEIYKLEKFEGGQLYFLYRPLNSHQTLFVGNSL